MDMIKLGQRLELFKIDSENYVVRTIENQQYGNIVWKMFKGTLGRGEFRFHNTFNSIGLTAKGVVECGRDICDFIEYCELNRLPRKRQAGSGLTQINDGIVSIYDSANNSLAPDGMTLDPKTGSAVYVGTGGDMDKLEGIKKMFFADNADFEPRTIDDHRERGLKKTWTPKRPPLF